MKYIPGFEGRYSATEDGRIFSHARPKTTAKNGFLAIHKRPNGYRFVRISTDDGVFHNCLVHRLVAMTYLGTEIGDIVDHIDGGQSNNRVDNLRTCTASQNQGNRKRGKDNTSGFKGVCWSEGCKKWQMSCRINGTRVYAWFADKIDAAKAYDKVAIAAHGSFARLNFPNG